MTSGWLFLGVTAAICIGVFVSGLRFARMTTNPWVGNRLGSHPVEGHDWSINKIRLFGRLQMIAAPIFLVIFACLAFGVFGPVNGIQTITLPSE